MEKLTGTGSEAGKGWMGMAAWLIVVLVPLLMACGMIQQVDAIVVDSLGRGYYIHGDTLETDAAPESCVLFADTVVPRVCTRKAMRRAYPFLACRDTAFTHYGETGYAHLYSYGSTQILTTDFGLPCIAYASITDVRIKLQRGIHVGMDREEVIHRIGLPAIEREINHIIFRADATVGGSVYRFDFSDGVLRSIRIQTTDWNDLAWNPAPYFDFVEPELARADHGPKIYAHGRDSLSWFAPVCYLNARGDTIVPFSRGYTYQNWKEIGRLGLVHAKPGKDYIAINYKGEVLFRVFGLLDASPDFVGDGLFRIIEGADNKIGYADTLGHVVIAPQFAYGTPFRYGRAKVTKTGHWDKSNPEMPEWKSGDWYYIDRTGRRVE